MSPSCNLAKTKRRTKQRCCHSVCCTSFHSKSCHLPVEKIDRHNPSKLPIAGETLRNLFDAFIADASQRRASECQREKELQTPSKCGTDVVMNFLEDFLFVPECAQTAEIPTTNPPKIRSNVHHLFLNNLPPQTERFTNLLGHLQPLWQTLGLKDANVNPTQLQKIFVWSYHLSGGGWLVACGVPTEDKSQKQNFGPNPLSRPLAPEVAHHYISKCQAHVTFTRSRLNWGSVNSGISKQWFGSCGETEIPIPLVNPSLTPLIWTSSWPCQYPH